MDYGYDRPGCGDTLQAVYRHAYADPFEAPGERDLTAHVDFAALAAAAEGVRVSGPVPQGAWLDAMGLPLRAAALARAAPDRTGGDRGRPRPPLRARRRWAGCSRCWRLPPRNGRSPPGSDMAEFTYRNATAADAALMSRLGPETFTETFGHLYTPENLAAFLRNHSVENWAAELTDPGFTVRHCRAGRGGGRLRQARPALACPSR